MTGFAAKPQRSLGLVFILTANSESSAVGGGQANIGPWRREDLDAANTGGLGDRSLTEPADIP